ALAGLHGDGLRGDTRFGLASGRPSGRLAERDGHLATHGGGSGGRRARDTATAPRRRVPVVSVQDRPSPRRGGGRTEVVRHSDRRGYPQANRGTVARGRARTGAPRSRAEA